MSGVGFSEAQLRDAAGVRSFERGLEYTGAVSGLEVLEAGATATVHGGSAYRVELGTGRGGGLRGECSCPYGREGHFCKHCVAVGLVLLSRAAAVPGQRAEAERGRRDLDEWLEARSQGELLALVREQVAQDRALRRRLELRAAADSADVDAMRVRIRALLDASPFSQYGFVEYADADAYAEQVAEAVRAIGSLLETDYVEQAVEVAREALRSLASTYESVDDSSGQLGSVVEELGQVHLDACRAAQAAPEETAEWLFAHLTGPGGDLLDIDVTDYFDVLGAAGKARLDALVTEAWHRHPSDWTLKHLKQQLARLEDDVDAVVAVYAADLAPTGATHLQVARELDAAGRSGEALEWATRGLEVASSAAPAGRVDSGLVDYLCDRYQAAGRAELAVEIRRDRLRAELSLAAYQRLRRAAQADGCWPAERGPALEVLRAEALKQAERPWRSPAAWIDALVDDGDLEEAWVAATGVATDQQWLTLADLVSAQRPGEALKVYLRAVEPLTAVTGEAAYRQILRLLVSARACHEALGTLGEFDVYVAALRAGQKRKRNLMRLLDQHGL
ncbi:SWIM zinc finger family protein [Streptacidiphilus rugosus]|uniref:SWIM zinc finger family protein n=1 Tax=Streptacidiphilus rugosus TaxID=405783 RepID=UPI00055C83D6|nr:DUF6880 family protein [Streptacidiphilus rugosus]